MGENTKSIFTDAYILLLIISVILGGVRLLSMLLYPEEDKSGTVYIRADNIDTRYGGSLSAGDVLYDSLTKRRVGKISYIYTDYHDGAADIFIKIEAERTPRGPLRCHKLWFEWERVNEQDFKYR